MIAKDYSHIKLEDLPRIPLAARLSLKNVPAVYFLIKDGDVVYIGSAVNLNRRININHHIVKTIGTNDVFIAWHEDHFLEVHEIESHFLRQFRPTLNKVIPKAWGELKASVYVSKETKSRISDLGIKNLDELINPALDALEREKKAKK